MEKLIYLNFIPLLLNIDRQSLFSDFDSLIVEKYAIDLLSAFLYRPILDINGKDWSNEIGGIPMCSCLLSNLLLNHVMRVFDPIFLSKFSNHARYLYEAFLPITKEESFSIEHRLSFLKDISFQSNLA